MVFDFLACRLLAQLPERLDRQRSTLLASHLDLGRRFVAVYFSLMRQHLDADLNAARIPLANSWLQRQQHALAALGVELAVSLGLGIGKPGDRAPKRAVNRLG